MFPSHDPLGLEDALDDSEDWLQEIEDINGIGPETVDDIKILYKSKEELIEALEKDEVPFRNNYVKLLKSHLLKGGI